MNITEHGRIVLRGSLAQHASFEVKIAFLLYMQLYSERLLVHG